jgi:uncharacterized cupredoxin-like copper-binding protein
MPLPTLPSACESVPRETIFQAGEMVMTRADHHCAGLKPRGPILILMLLLSGCAAKDITATDTSGYVGNVEKRVAAVDWNKADIVAVALSEYQYTPSSLRFQSGHAYRLRLTNTGGETHDFASKPFFQAIAAARLIAPGKTTPLPHLESIGTRPGETKELDFVAVRPGTYSFECREPLHALLGMTGTARIE